MTKKLGTKRHRAGVKARRCKPALLKSPIQNPVENERLATIKVLFRRVLGMTPGEIRSFQLCQTVSGYHTVYLKDLPTL